MGSCYVCSNCGACREEMQKMVFMPCPFCGKPADKSLKKCPCCGHELDFDACEERQEETLPQHAIK